MNDELRVKNNELGGKMKYRYRTDEEMKDSGVEWIGEIPKEWSITKLKYISCCEDGKRVPLSSDERGKMQGDIPYWGANSIIDYVNDYLIDYEVVLLGEDGAPFFDKTKPVAFYSNGKIWPNNHIHILKSQKDMDSRFLVNSLNIVDYKNYIKGSTRDKLTQADMKEIIIQIPKLKKEQIKISKFLDEKTAQFDSIISKKEALIEKLEEAKKILISEVVTGKVKVVKTNDGYELVERKKEEMKDSGVEWIGKIPKGWECNNFRRSVTLKQGLQIAQSDRYYEAGDGRYIYITVKYINSDKDKNNTEYILNPDKGGVCNKEDVLLARTGATGKVVTNIEGVFHNNFFKIIYDKSKLIKEYLVYYLIQKNVQEYLKLVAGTTTIPDLNHGDFLSTKLVLPNKIQQEKIVEFLNEKTAHFDSIISKKEALIEKLKEAKQSLISEAVTGKIEILD